MHHGVAAKGTKYDNMATWDVGCTMQDKGAMVLCMPLFVYSAHTRVLRVCVHFYVHALNCICMDWCMICFYAAALGQPIKSNVNVVG